jgi:hypothetical protein
LAAFETLPCARTLKKGTFGSVDAVPCGRLPHQIGGRSSPCKRLRINGKREPHRTRSANHEIIPINRKQRRATPVRRGRRQESPSFRLCLLGLLVFGRRCPSIRLSPSLISFARVP